MRRLIRTLAAMALAGVVIALALGWLVLQSPLFEAYRKHKVADLLTRLTRSEVVVAGEVSVDVGRTIRIDARDLSMPLGTKSADNVLDVGRAQIGVRLSDLLKGTLDIRELLFESVNANYVMTAGDAAKPSASTPQTLPTAEKPKSGGSEAVLAFLTRRQARAQDLNILIRDENTGFVFDFKLKALDVDPASETEPLKISGSGMVNGEPFSLDGNFPDAAPFRAEADFGTGRVLFEGTPGPFTDEFDARLSLDVDRIEDLLSGLRLRHDISGSATLTADLARADQITALTKLESLITLDGGQTVTTRGDLGDLSSLDNIDLEIDVKLYPDDMVPKPARKLQDLKLVGLRYVTRGSLYNADNSILSLIWNGFELKSGGAGPSPIVVRDIRRTEDGLLQFGDVKLLVGTPASPVMTFEGSIGDALNLKDFDLQGALNLPVPSLLDLENVPKTERLGKIKGSVHLKGSGNKVSVTDVNAWLEDSDLWSLSFRGEDTAFSQADPSSLKSAPFGFDLELKIPQANSLLTTLGLKPVDVTNIDLTGHLERDDAVWNSTISVVAGQSRIASDLKIYREDNKIKARGQLTSDSVRLSDLSGTVATAIQLSALEQAPSDDPDKPPDREVQPLVLNKAQDIAAAPSEDKRPVQPLVMPRQDDEAGGGSAPPGAEQTVTSGGEEDTIVADSNGIVLEKSTSLEIVNDNQLLRMLDLEYGIAIREVRGLRGVSSVNSELTAKNGKARLGPLDFNYGGGHFRLDGSIDVLEQPDILNISGATGGWDIRKVLSALEIDIAGRGILNARFDLSGNRRSLKRFAETLNGTAIVGMRNGSIDNTLIDLAGLGVLPWLFSSQRQAGSVDIVCLNAPLRISGGKISSDPLVAETRDVQLVAKAEVDLRDQTIYLEGRPRKIGQPLSRSPWPFTVSGPLSKPDMNLRSLPRRQWRSDGATEMPKTRKLCVPDILQLR